MVQKAKKRIWYWDILRIAAMVFLVVRHSATATFEFVPTLETDWWVCNVYGSLSAWMVPVFMMISGASFLDPARNVTIDRLYKRNIFRMLCAFFFWAVFYAVYNTFSGQELKEGFADMVFKGHFHLWFLPAMALCSCALPLLHGLAYGKKDEVFFGALLLLALVLLLSTLEAIPVKSARLAAFLSAWRLRDLRYLIYMPVGWLFSRRRLTGRQLTALGLAALAALLVSARLNRVLALRAGMAVDTLYGNLTVSAGLTALFLFCLCRRLNSLPERAARLLRTLSDCSLGVYLMHPILIDALRSRHLDLAQYSAAWLLPLCLLCFLLGSFALSRALRRIPFLRQLVS